MNARGSDCSVVLPTFNAGDRVIAQIESILDQTVPPDRILIRDDASTDDTYELLTARYVGDDRILIERNDRNRGQEATIERLLAQVETEYVAISDQDDVWLRWKLEATLDRLRSTNVDLVYSDLRPVGPELETIAESAIARSGAKVVSGRVPIALLVRSPVHGCTVVARRSLLRDALPFPPDVPHYDRWLALVASARGGIAVLDVPTVLYRQHDANLVGNVRGGPRGLRALVQRRGGGSLGAYLTRRQREHSALAHHLEHRRLGGWRVRFIARYLAMGRLSRAVLAPVYFGVVASAARQVGLPSIVGDVLMVVAAPSIGIDKQLRRIR